MTPERLAEIKNSYSYSCSYDCDHDYCCIARRVSEVMGETERLQGLVGQVEEFLSIRHLAGLEICGTDPKALDNLLAWHHGEIQISVEFEGREENAELRETVERLQAALPPGSIGEMIWRQNDRLLAENAELREDATRLDWLESNLPLSIIRFRESECVGDVIECGGGPPRKTLRDAIDAAIKAEPPCEK